jgi:hypothetical protein
MYCIPTVAAKGNNVRLKMFGDRALRMAFEPEREDGENCMHNEDIHTYSSENVTRTIKLWRLR